MKGDLARALELHERGGIRVISMSGWPTDMTGTLFAKSNSRWPACTGNPQPAICSSLLSVDWTPVGSGGLVIADGGILGWTKQRRYGGWRREGGGQQALRQPIGFLLASVVLRTIGQGAQEGEHGRGIQAESGHEPVPAGVATLPRPPGD